MPGRIRHVVDHGRAADNLASLRVGGPYAARGVGHAGMVGQDYLVRVRVAVEIDRVEVVMDKTARGSDGVMVKASVNMSGRRDVHGSSNQVMPRPAGEELERPLPGLLEAARVRVVPAEMPERTGVVDEVGRRLGDCRGHGGKKDLPHDDMA